MGQASNVSQEIMSRPLSAVESDTRRKADRELINPDVNLDGEIVERPRPQAPPQPVIVADSGTWD